MAIVINRRNQKVAEAFLQARAMSRKKLAGWAELERRQQRRRGAAVRRYAKKYNLGLRYYRKPWIYGYRSRIAMPAGYFTRVDGVLHQLIAV